MLKKQSIYIRRLSIKYLSMEYFLLSIFFIWRLTLFLIAWLGEKLVSFTPSFPYSDIYLIPSGLPNWLWSFANFDGVHYLTIAISGYSAQFTQVFFPLYPLLVGLLIKLFLFLPPIIIGLLVSNLFFLFALVVAWKLFYLDYKKQEIRWMILFLSFFPTSFFFGSFYTESFFLFLVITSFYFARKRQWLISGILGGLASATRLVGIFLLPALLWEWHRNIKYTNNKLNSKDLFSKTLHSTFNILHSPILYLVPLGLISYMCYLQYKFGDFLYFWHAQPVFGAQRSGEGMILLPQVIFRYLKILLSIPTSSLIFWTSFSELLFCLVVILLLLIAHRLRIRLSYLIFSWLALLAPTLTGTFSSIPRYVLVVFPIYIVLGLIKNKILKVLILTIFFILLSLYTILFTSGHWVS